MLLVQLGHKVLGGLAVCTVLPQSGSGLAPSSVGDRGKSVDFGCDTVQNRCHSAYHLQAGARGAMVECSDTQ